jgi:hypothetical protein
MKILKIDYIFGGMPSQSAKIRRLFVDFGLSISS